MKDKNANDQNNKFGGAAQAVGSVIQKTDSVMRPLRDSVFKRFPIVFILLTTFGVSAVFFAFERLIAEWQYLFERPWLILFIGIVALILSGQLYKKLG